MDEDEHLSRLHDRADRLQLRTRALRASGALVPDVRPYDDAMALYLRRWGLGSYRQHLEAMGVYCISDIREMRERDIAPLGMTPDDAARLRQAQGRAADGIAMAPAGETAQEGNDDDDPRDEELRLRIRIAALERLVAADGGCTDRGDDGGAAASAALASAQCDVAQAYWDKGLWQPAASHARGALSLLQSHAPVSMAGDTAAAIATAAEIGDVQQLRELFQRQVRPAQAEHAEHVEEATADRLAAPVLLKALVQATAKGSGGSSDVGGGGPGGGALLFLRHSRGLADLAQADSCEKILRKASGGGSRRIRMPPQLDLEATESGRDTAPPPPPDVTWRQLLAVLRKPSGLGAHGASAFAALRCRLERRLCEGAWAGERNQAVPQVCVRRLNAGTAVAAVGGRPADAAARVESGGEGEDEIGTSVPPAVRRNTGDIVECMASEKHCPAEIEVDHGDGTYDVRFDDGAIARGVPAGAILAADDDGGSGGAAASPVSPAPLRIGDAVDCRGSKKKCFGAIAGCNGDGTYDVKFADGDLAQAVPEAAILRMQGSASPAAGAAAFFDIGNTVYAPAPASSAERLHKCEIVGYNDDDTYEVRFINGGVSKVGAELIVREEGILLPRYEIGARAFAPAQGSDELYPCKVKATNGDGTLELLFDDGEEDPGAEASAMAPEPDEARQFAVGERVHAFATGDEEKIYPGCISKENDDGTYAITFDDGDVEDEVPLSKITQRQPIVARQPSQTSAVATKQFAVGDAVRSRCKGGSERFAAKIFSVHLDGSTYDVLFFDGDRNGAVPESRIVQDGAPPLRAGDAVTVPAEATGLSAACPGKVYRLHSDGTCDVKYTRPSGATERKRGIPAALLSKAPPAPKRRSSAVIRRGRGSDRRRRAGAGFRVGDVVRCRGSGKSCPATIFSVGHDLTYDVKFDDGDCAHAVPEREIVLGVGEETAAARAARLGAGDEVEVWRCDGAENEAEVVAGEGEGLWFRGQVLGLSEHTGSIDVRFEGGGEALLASARQLFMSVASSSAGTHGGDSGAGWRPGAAATGALVSAAALAHALRDKDGEGHNVAMRCMRRLVGSKHAEKVDGGGDSEGKAEATATALESLLTSPYRRAGTAVKSDGSFDAEAEHVCWEQWLALLLRARFAACPPSLAQRLVPPLMLIRGRAALQYQRRMRKKQEKLQQEQEQQTGHVLLAQQDKTAPPNDDMDEDSGLLGGGDDDALSASDDPVAVLRDAIAEAEVCLAYYDGDSTPLSVEAEASAMRRCAAAAAAALSDALLVEHRTATECARAAVVAAAERWLCTTTEGDAAMRRGLRKEMDADNGPGAGTGGAAGVERKRVMMDRVRRRLLKRRGAELHEPAPEWALVEADAVLARGLQVVLPEEDGEAGSDAGRDAEGNDAVVLVAARAALHARRAKLSQRHGEQAARLAEQSAALNASFSEQAENRAKHAAVHLASLRSGGHMVPHSLKELVEVLGMPEAGSDGAAALFGSWVEGMAAVRAATDADGVGQGDTLFTRLVATVERALEHAAVSAQQAAAATTLQLAHEEKATASLRECQQAFGSDNNSGAAGVAPAAAARASAQLGAHLLRIMQLRGAAGVIDTPVAAAEELQTATVMLEEAASYYQGLAEGMEGRGDISRAVANAERLWRLVAAVCLKLGSLTEDQPKGRANAVEAYLKVLRVSCRCCLSVSLPACLTRLAALSCLLAHSEQVVQLGSGEHSVAVSEVHQALAQLYVANDQGGLAKKAYREAIRVQTMHFGKRSVRVLDAQELAAWCVVKGEDWTALGKKSVFHSRHGPGEVKSFDEAAGRWLIEYKSLQKEKPARVEWASLVKLRRAHIKREKEKNNEGPILQRMKA